MFIPTFRTFSNHRVSTWVMRLLQVGALLGFTVRDSDAQDSVALRRPGNIVGFSVGVPGADGQASLLVTTIGFNATHVVPWRPGFDVAVGTAPILMGFGVATVGARAGVVLPVPVTPQLMILPGAGLSFVGASGGDEIAGATGWNLNVALIAAASRSTALRTGLSVHRFDGVNGVWLYETGFVWFVH
jgi:hypothetical protein